MVRRFARPATILIVMACATLTVPPSDFLEAVTANLADLLVPGATLTEGDKTFSNFSYSPIPVSVSDPGGSLTLLSAADITVTTATGPGGVITLSVPLGMSASVGPPGGADVDTVGLASFGFDVSVTGSDVISAVTVSASGAETGPNGDAQVGTNFSSGGFSNISPPGSSTTAIPDLQTLGVASDASVIAEVPGDSALIDELIFTISQTTPSTPSTPVPEAGSLTLILGGVGMLLARSIYRRRS